MAVYVSTTEIDGVISCVCLSARPPVSRLIFVAVAQSSASPSSSPYFDHTSATISWVNCDFDVSFVCLWARFNEKVADEYGWPTTRILNYVNKSKYLKRAGGDENVCVLGLLRVMLRVRAECHVVISCSLVLGCQSTRPWSIALLTAVQTTLRVLNQTARHQRLSPETAGASFLQTYDTLLAGCIYSRHSSSYSS